SQDEFAELIKVSVRQLRRWEAGLSHASVENLQDIAEVTGIPMEACIALNADNPLWYSLQKRRFAYTSIEVDLVRVNDLLKSYKQSDRAIPIKNEQIITDKHIDMILSYHRDSYGNEKQLSKNVFMKAINIMPVLNRVIFDQWGLMVGYVVCLPIRIDMYQELIKQKILEDYLTTETISDISALDEGVFFHYSIFSVSLSVAYPMIVNNLRYFSKIKQKKGYLAAFHTATIKGKEFFDDLGMRIAWNSGAIQDIHPDAAPSILEIELDSLVKKMKNYNPPLAVDTPLNVDAIYLDTKETEISTDKSETRICINPACEMKGKAEQGNIICNGTYRTKEGAMRRRFKCKQCGVSFSSKAGTIFYGLRSPEEKIMMALKLLVNGMSLTGVADAMNVKFDTVRRWLKVVSGQRGKIDGLLIDKLKVSQAQLDTLWAYISENSLRQRASLLKKSYKSHN
ncbi:MAG: helix-turn-helix domain-containing protein, partial [Proteobacteria bacterium]|nr:helix-turn-helix domain-containing protein [Pseudomonadota bacterium]